ncbi:MAG: rhomboid family intramembrane serine protease [Planctomycetota bacterium]
MLIPYQVAVPMARWPVANFVLIGVVSLISMAALLGVDSDTVETMILDDWSPTSLFGHALLHADLLHLLGNMIFLWVFGNAVCAKFGNGAYLAIFAGLAVAAATVHNLLDGAPAVGASGAINGVVGLFLVFFPRNDISCFYFFIVKVGTFTVSSGWMILLWLAFDLWGAATGGAGVAYWAHLGGFGAGVALGLLALQTGWIKTTSYEESILDVMRNHA